MQACRKCGILRPPADFPLTRSGRLSMRCKQCDAQRKSAYSKVWYERNKARLAGVRSKWYQANKHRNAAAKASYRARRRKQTYPLTDAQKAEIIAIYLRARQLTQKTGIQHHVDHIHPLCHPLLSGLHVPANLQVLPGKLNKKKSNNLTLDTLARRVVSFSDVDET